MSIRKLSHIAYNSLKKILFIIDDKIFSIPTKNKNEYDYLIYKMVHLGIPSSINFDFEFIKKQTISFIENARVNKKFYKYKFSSSQKEENVYSSVYACLIYDMYGELDKFTDIQKKKWVDYFDSFQSPKDGLWYDPNLKNEHYDNSDWWGARHLAVHMIAGYAALNSKPKYKISYVEKYYDKSYLYSWLNSFDWNSFFDHKNDADNKIMNIASIMQYNRDFFEDIEANRAMNNLYDYLDTKINPKTGMWGKCDTKNKYQLSRCIQFAYHLLMPYFYDKREVIFKKKILYWTLKTQNKLGGFGEKLNSSACEDIDSVDLIIQLSDSYDKEVKQSLLKAFTWILSNRNIDGGFVFRLCEPMWYGHDILRAKKNESHFLATWFRTLSLLKLTKKLNINNDFNYTKIPGY